MGVRLHLSRLDPDLFFEVTGEACRVARTFPALDHRAPDWIPEALPDLASRAIGALLGHHRSQWERAYYRAVMSPWDVATHDGAVEHLDLDKTWSAFQVLTDAAGWAGERVSAPVSAGPLARAVFGVHGLPPALARVLDFPLRFVLPPEVAPLAAALLDADLGGLADAVDRDELPAYLQESLDRFPMDDTFLDALRAFYDRAQAGGEVILSTLG